MPHAKEISPLAILGTRATGTAAQVSKKGERFHSSLSLQRHATHSFSNVTGVRHSTPIFNAVRAQARSKYHLGLQVRCDLPMSPFSPHGTHNCVSTPTLRKIPEERRPSTLTNNSWLMVLRGKIAIQGVPTVR